MMARSRGQLKTPWRKLVANKSRQLWLRLYSDGAKPLRISDQLYVAERICWIFHGDTFLEAAPEYRRGLAHADRHALLDGEPLARTTRRGPIRHHVTR